jgi:predicted acylesterase/phospholipase RssA
LLRDERFFGAVAIEDLWRRFFCVSTNLSRGSEVVHEDGPAWEGVRASIAIPGVLPPVVRAGELLVDGALLNNLPVDLMRERIRDGKIIAVDLDPLGDEGPPADFEPTVSGWRLLARRMRRQAGVAAVPSIIDVVLRSKDIAGRRTQRAVVESAAVDLLLRPPTGGCAAMDFRGARPLIEVGYRYAADILERHGVDHLADDRQYPRSGDRGAA